MPIGFDPSAPQVQTPTTTPTGPAAPAGGATATAGTSAAQPQRGASVDPGLAPQSPVAAAIRQSGTADAQKNAAALGGKAPASIKSPFDFPTRDKIRDMGTKLGAVINDELQRSKAGAHLREAEELGEIWAKYKSDKMASIWAKHPEMPRQVSGYVSWYMYDPSGIHYVERAMQQNADLSLWEKFVTDKKIIEPLDDEWLRLLELMTFYLEAGVDDADDEHLDGGRGIMNGYHSGLSSLTQVEREKLGALLASSGPHMYKHDGINEYDSRARSKILVDLEKNPDEAKAKIKSRMGNLTWLDDPNELRQFKDALLLLKLADWSRGQAMRSSDLSRCHPMTTDWMRDILRARQS